MDPKRSKEITFTLAGHAHLDPVWLWDKAEGAETVKATLRSALDRLQENPDLVFVHTSAAQYSWMTIYPQMMEEIRAAIARGQWEPVGGFWVEPDMNIPSGEGLARQALYGQRFFERVLGKRARISFLPDSFGHPVTLPQIFKLSGLEYFLFWRPTGKEIELPSNLFWWEGPDGTRMLSARIESYNSNPREVVETLTASIDWRPEEVPEWITIYGVGNHGGGPTIKAINSMRELQKDPEWPTLQFGTIQGFFERAVGQAHPTYNQGLQHQFRGCYTSHALIKKLNRKGELALQTAEKWSVIAQQYGLAYPAQRFEDAWHHVLFNQFHDIICGTSIARAYEDCRNEMGEAIGFGHRTLHDAMSVIAQQIDTRSGDHKIEEAMRRPRSGGGNVVADLGDGVPVVVFNPSPWTRREVIDVEVNDWHVDDMQVWDDKNQAVVHQFAQPEARPPRKRAAFLVEVPPMGYRVYRLVDREPATFSEDAPMLQITESVLENTWWRLELDPRTGALRSLKDKSADLELLAGGGAQVLVIDDPTNPWGEGSHFRHLGGVFTEPQVKVVENGPVRATWEIITRWGKSTARQTITLYRETPAIHGHLEVDWHEEYLMVKLAFPFNLEEATATFSVPFGHVVRPAAGQEEPSQQWLDVTGRLKGKTYGVAVLNDCKYGADVLGGEARISILRSPFHGAGNRLASEPRPGDKYLDQGLQEMNWALVPHSGAWQDARIPQAAQDFNEPLTFVREYAHAGELPKAQSFLTIEPPDQVVVTALKQAEESSDWVLRLYEPNGRRAEAVVNLPVLGAKVKVEAGPNQIKTYRIATGGAVREVNFLEE